MRKIFYTSLLLILTNHAIAQTSDNPPPSNKLKKYISGGISIGNVDAGNPSVDNFDKASYPSIEGGIMGKRVSLGLVLGCENFFVSKDSRYFYELKTTFSVPIEMFSAYALFGTGAYFEKKFNNFIEYGVGFSYMPNKLGYFVQYSNWAKSNYVSVGTTFAF